MDYTGCGNTLNMLHPRTCPAHHGQPALLGHWRCTSTASASTWPATWPASCTTSTGWRLLRHHPPGPGPLPGEADRRAVGRRRGRLPGGQLPGALDRVERQVPRHRAALLEGRRRPVAELAYRLTGSSDLYEGAAACPYASINFVTAHDGFTLRDLVSYNEKHNEANGEGNRDGESHNLSWNCGVEGRPTTRRPRPARPPDAQLHGHAAGLAGRADDPARRRGGPHPGRQQQRLLPGQHPSPPRRPTRRRSSAEGRAAGAARAGARRPARADATPAPPRRGRAPT